MDLRATVEEIDRPLLKPYRAYLLHYLKESYLKVAERGRHVSPYGLVRQANTLRAWDTVTVVPRFGFASVDDYYERMSVGPILAGLKVPSLVIAAEDDPMVPAQSLRPHLENPGEHLHVHWAKRGGHVGFPLDFDMQAGGPTGLAEQAIHWLERYTD